MARPANPSPPMKILAIGAGAVGSYVGGSLALSGHQLVFAEQPAAVEALRERGLRLDLSADRRRKARDAFLLPPSAFVVAASLEEALRFGPFDQYQGRPHILHRCHAVLDLGPEPQVFHGLFFFFQVLFTGDIFYPSKQIKIFWSSLIIYLLYMIQKPTDFS